MSFITNRIAGFFTPQTSASKREDPLVSGSVTAGALFGVQHEVGSNAVTDFAFTGRKTGREDMSSDNGGLEEEGRPPYLHVRSPCTAFHFVPSRGHYHEVRMI